MGGCRESFWLFSGLCSESCVNQPSMNPLAFIVQVTGFTFAMHLMGWGKMRGWSGVQRRAYFFLIEQDIKKKSLPNIFQTDSLNKFLKKILSKSESKCLDFLQSVSPRSNPGSCLPEKSMSFPDSTPAQLQREGSSLPTISQSSPAQSVFLQGAHTFSWSLKNDTRVKKRKSPVLSIYCLPNIELSTYTHISSFYPHTYSSLIYK